MSPCSKQSIIDRTYAVLKDGRWHSTRELRQRVGRFFSVGIYKLRGAGYRVVKRGHSRIRSHYMYRLVGTEIPTPRRCRQRAAAAELCD